MTIIPENYNPYMDIRETEVAIKLIKDQFEQKLATSLNLTRVSAPLFVFPETGLNDNLNGVERPVAFGIKEQGDAICEIVHSLAKWKRQALKRYGFGPGEGLYTDMNAIRRDEDTDNLHSIYVDQWDWEAVLNREDRNINTLKIYVEKIYKVLKSTENAIVERYPKITPFLPETITFIDAQELEDKYPNLPSKERERLAAKEHGAIFIIGIGKKLSSGKPHDGRAPDYDDWNLNGDIIVYYPLLDVAFELSSMGIRVDAHSLKSQLQESNCVDRADLPFHKALLNNELPLTIGGGIGQSRLCMLLLRRAHIGEVQSSIWTQEAHEICDKNNITLL